MTQPEEEKGTGTESVEHPELHQFLRWAKEYGRSMGIGVIGAILVIVVFTTIRSRRENQVQDAATMLAGARTPEQFDAIRDRFERTPSAPLAVLRLGGALARAGKWDEALAVFQTFPEKYSGHFFRPAADLNAALCLESLGRLDEAARAYDDWNRNNPAHYLQPLSRLGRARCEELAGRLDEARSRYEEFIAAYPESRWTVQAEAALRSLGTKVPTRTEEILDGTEKMLQDP